jgi:TRAP-type C4-dicarboxylate transport system permease small subunit
LDLLIWLSGFLVGLLTVGVGLDVLSRNMGWGGLPWVFDLVEYGLLLVTMGMAAAILRLERHVEVDLLLILAPSGIARAMRLFSAAGLIGISAILAWYAGAAAWQSFSQGSVLFRYILIPEWVPFFAVSFMFLTLAIEGIRRLQVASAKPINNEVGRSDAF